MNAPTASFGPWNPGLQSQIPRELLPLSTMFRRENVSTRIDDVHELRALGFLKTGFDHEVIEPIRLHVQAKRFLVASDLRYAQGLSLASLQSLSRQGGRMNAEERLLFLARPFASQALQLRRWDDLAKHPGKRTPPLAYFLNLLDDVLRAARQPARVVLA